MERITPREPQRIAKDGGNPPTLLQKIAKPMHREERKEEEIVRLINGF